jgi:type I restriction enzyme M protein
MNQSQYNQLFSFIWNIATDVLVYAFEKGEYKKIIMPMMVLRRIDVLLEPTKQQLLTQKALLDKNKIQNQDPILYTVTGYPFYNTSKFTMKTLKSETDPLRLKMNFNDYLNGFSRDVQDIIDKFHLRQMVDNLTEAERLGSIIEKFTDDKINLSNKPVLDDNGNVRLPGLDNHTMGTIFEELLRKFNEENNVTEAGEHFTPRDYVKLLADLAVLPIADKITDNTYHIYDGACGTGGILTIAQDRIMEIAKERGKQVSVNIFGQELQPDTFATCKADLMISGNIKAFQYQYGTEAREYIAFDSTISRDGHAGETFDFCISNPPFGTPWKEDLKKRGLSEKERDKFTDSRFSLIDKDGKEISFLTDIGDCQMMFLANNISRMRNDTQIGTRIVEVHNGSSLYSTRSTDGDNVLRKYILDNDLLEAIIAMPENEFYNTGLGTYIWILSNRKEKRRKGKIQLINACEFTIPQRPKLGKKKIQIGESDREKIISLLMDFDDNEYSKIVTPDELGYWEVQLYKKNINGKLERLKNEKEYIPLNYPGGVEGFCKNELSFLGDNIIASDAKLFYEISFTKYFYKPILPRKREDIIGTFDDSIHSIQLLKMEIDVLSNKLKELKELKPYNRYKECDIQWIGYIPEGWDISKVRQHFIQRINKVSDKDYMPLSVTKAGIVPQLDTVALSNAEGNSRKEVKINDFVVNSRSDRKGSCGVSKYDGSVSLINIILEPKDILPDYAHYLFRTSGWIEEFFKNGQGIAWDLWTTNYQKMKNMLIVVPDMETQKVIVKIANKLDEVIYKYTVISDAIKSNVQQIISDVVTGQVNVQNEI